MSAARSQEVNDPLNGAIREVTTSASNSGTATSTIVHPPLIASSSMHPSLPVGVSLPAAHSFAPFPTNFAHGVPLAPQYPTASYPPVAASVEPPEAPPSFPWRSGKWLPAEEHYALLLVALFERGMIADGVDGTTTLRTYLSQKLHCAPMRISKKFAGRGIGKLVYSSASSKPCLEPQKGQELLERLRIAEQLFLQAAYPPSVVASLGASAFPLLSVPPTVTQPLPVFPPAIMPGMAPTASVVPTSATGDGTTHTKQLHESYLRALQLADEDASQNGSAAMPPPPMNPAVTTASEIPDLLSGFEKVVQTIQSTTTPAPQVELPTHPPPEAEYSPPFTSRSFDEFHRFLGKDELTMLDASPPSPQNNNMHVTVARVVEPTAPVLVHDTAALFSAESYAMLAQASAMEASRHGAYSMPPNTTFDVDQVLQQVGAHHPTRASTHISPSNCKRTIVEVNRGSHHLPPVTTDLHNTSRSHAWESADTNIGAHHPTCASTHISPSNGQRNIVEVNRGSHHLPPVTTDLHNTSRPRARESADANIVSGSEPSGSSSSRSNTSNTSSGSEDTTGTASNEDDCSDEGGGSCDTSSDSSIPPDDEMPLRKKSKVAEKRGDQPKRVQFQ